MTEASHPSSLGARIRALLESRGMSQTALAARAGVDRAELNRLVNDHRPPRLEEIAWIAEALGVAIEDLIGDLQLPPELRRALGHFGGLARRMLQIGAERDEARARVSALEAELVRERCERRGEKDALEREAQRLRSELSRSRTALVRDQEGRRGNSTDPAETAAMILAVGLLGRSIVPATRV